MLRKRTSGRFFKKWKKLLFEVGEGSVFLRAESGLLNGCIDIPAGNDDLTYEVSLKSGMITALLYSRILLIKKTRIKGE